MGISDCKIVSVGKRRDGGTRYWCSHHRADATAKYGRKAKKCRYANLPEIPPDQILKLDVSQYPTGIALWGAVPPVYDTTRLPVDRGIHVHARRNGDGTKEIDETFRKVVLTNTEGKEQSVDLEVTELDSIYFMVTSVFGYPTKYIECTYCGYVHLDKDWFSVHSHRRHLCAGCGKHFRDDEVAIGNPLVRIRTSLSKLSHSRFPATKRLQVSQSDFPGGLQIWGSNPAIVWTAEKPEEEGIHIHAFAEGLSEPAVDDTFSKIEIDGMELNVEMIRTLMAQNVLPHIVGRVMSIACPMCEFPHFDRGEHAFTPHVNHQCEHCNAEFTSRGRLRKTIGNPLVDIIEHLSQYAPRSRQAHNLGLLPETPF